MFTDPFKLRVELFALHFCASQFTSTASWGRLLQGSPGTLLGNLAALFLFQLNLQLVSAGKVTAGPWRHKPLLSIRADVVVSSENVPFLSTSQGF